MQNNRTERIRSFLLENAETPSLGPLAAKRFKITRQAINRHLNALTKEGFLLAVGKTRNREYELAPLEQREFNYFITKSLEEDEVWGKDIRPLVNALPANVIDIWHFGFTEIFNNAIDHSAGKAIHVNVVKTAISTVILIVDNGIGIFRKIQSELNLADERHAILELSKGKLTTDAKNHAGWGIFFTSRVMDTFRILSGGVYFSHDVKEDEDWILENNPSRGTSVFLTLKNNTTRTRKKVFDQFTVNKQWGFNKTVVPVNLARYGNDQLVSRSQAKRLLARVDQFAHVIFDFSKVEEIGQAFADEIFRVFANEHPKVKLTTISANRSVSAVITAIRRGNRGK